MSSNNNKVLVVDNRRTFNGCGNDCGECWTCRWEEERLCLFLGIVSHLKRQLFMERGGTQKAWVEQVLANSREYDDDIPF